MYGIHLSCSCESEHNSTYICVHWLCGSFHRIEIEFRYGQRMKLNLYLTMRNALLNFIEAFKVFYEILLKYAACRQSESDEILNRTIDNISISFSFKNLSVQWVLFYLWLYLWFAIAQSMCTAQEKKSRVHISCRQRERIRAQTTSRIIMHTKASLHTYI